MFAGFQFVDDPSHYQAENSALVVRIPNGLRKKRELFAVLASTLDLPDYFGWNWDALEECLSDRGWLVPARPIVLLHKVLPLKSGSRAQRTYLQILAGVLKSAPPAVNGTAHDGQPSYADTTAEFTAVFARRDEADIRRLLDD